MFFQTCVNISTPCNSQTRGLANMYRLKIFALALLKVCGIFMEHVKAKFIVFFDLPM